MKGITGGILKKLSSIPQVGYLKQGTVLQLKASDDQLNPRSSPRDSNRPLCDLPVCRDDQKLSLQPELIDVSQLIRDLDDDETEPCDDKENIRPAPAPENPTPWKRKSSDRQRSELDVSSFRRPDLNSATLFDPDLLAAFEQAVMDHKARTMTRTSKEEDPHRNEEPPSKIARIDEERDPLTEFEDRCPPGGMGAVILYTTSLRGIRKTFEDCSSIRFLLESSKVLFQERDISMHMDFREELWGVLGGRAIPPRLFIKGRYIGGADEVLGLHEQGGLMPLVQGMPAGRQGAAQCEGCGGMRFMVCFKCSGGRKLYDDERAMTIQCCHCNENGLILCPICC